MYLAQGPQSSDAGEAQNCSPSVSSQALFHWATALSFICKYLKDLNKNCESVFSDAQGQLTVVSDGIWPIKSLMYFLITYKDEKNLNKKWRR